MTDLSLAKRVILITGAAGGLGQVLARHCAAQGATVILLDKTVPALEKLYDAILDDGSPEPALYPLNLAAASPADYQQLAAVVEEQFGGLHGLVHGAADLHSLQPCEHIKPLTWMEQIQVNLNGPFLLTQALLPLLKTSDEGRVVFVGDNQASQGVAYWGGYGVAKAAILAMTKMLAHEVTANTQIKINAINPSPMQTPLRYRTHPAGDVTAWQAPQDWTEMVSYLLSVGCKQQGMLVDSPTDVIFQSEKV